ncbi:hypothetical protein FIBSPDRAFT_896068 [Athelia psychrophila]|uniref:Uncharacterized protein n=1 Tax=Athelia psychrophila TaxID=1759441 RepID=A0A166DXJ9_9AGAM|nr:hypothetical protein FIBSPDRAFT_896068 [Fibularhizoctonia sp. CBS 109695]
MSKTTSRRDEVISKEVALSPLKTSQPSRAYNWRALVDVGALVTKAVDSTEPPVQETGTSYTSMTGQLPFFVSLERTKLNEREYEFPEASEKHMYLDETLTTSVLRSQEMLNVVGITRSKKARLASVPNGNDSVQATMGYPRRKDELTGDRYQNRLGATAAQQRNEFIISTVGSVSTDGLNNPKDRREYIT